MAGLAAAFNGLRTILDRRSILMVSREALGGVALRVRTQEGELVERLKAQLKFNGSELLRGGKSISVWMTVFRRSAPPRRRKRPEESRLSSG